MIEPTKMIYRLIASSRSRTTEVYEGEDGSLVEVYYFHSGAVEARPVPEIPEGLTVRYYGNDQEMWVTEPITKPVRFPSYEKI